MRYVTASSATVMTSTMIQMPIANVFGAGVMIHANTNHSGQVHIVTQAQRCRRRRPKTAIEKLKIVAATAVAPAARTSPSMSCAKPGSSAESASKSCQ